MIGTTTLIVDNSDTSQEESKISHLKSLNCSVCNIEVIDEDNLRQHLVSQKHKKTYRNLEQQQRIDKRCGLFIKGRQKYYLT